MNGFAFVQPVLVSGIHKRLNASLWKADSFNQEFADHQGDLLNCKDQVVANSGIKEFWDGFEDITSELTCIWFHCFCSVTQMHYKLLRNKKGIVSVQLKSCYLFRAAQVQGWRTYGL